MLKTLGILGLIALIAALLIGGAYAIDLPHTGNCNACHMIHNSLGPSLTNQATNELLCMSCHKVGGAASTRSFSSSDQAVPSVSGWSHSWSVSMNAGVPPLNLEVGNPNNKYGLKTAGEITNSAILSRLQNFGGIVSCSVCHNQHLQSQPVATPPVTAVWNPFTGPGGQGDWGSATGGTSTSIDDSARTTPWVANAWANYYVKMMTGENRGYVREIASNTANQLTLAAPFPVPVAAGDRYIIIGYSFPRINNDLNQLCVECHAYRVPTSVPPQGVSQTDVRTWDGNVKSHPINKVFTSTTREVLNPAQFNAAPLEPAAGGWAQQVGERYRDDAGTDTNHTNNLVMGPDGQIKCLTCHGVHYTDSNTATVDLP